MGLFINLIYIMTNNILNYEILNSIKTTYK